ncbi:SWIM zinc finger family protein [Microaerobacter geothermalis]|uniref:SWIM zinc finger family protein n=1 Tax=Microaerobacter geothermalis TaxID=674972 RepID=UPI001F3AE66F|nr:SWIM zinc finger family protein [Microaerobacter geothermalis]MCF6093284.1 SWIM zinc finger family protein [Microaerobacter geothermalis]
MKSNLQYLKQEMRRYIEPHIIQRGYHYYLDRQVEDLTIHEDWIEATVYGNYGEYTVRVNQHDFSDSECDCPYEDYCKHMAAVVYQAVLNQIKPLGDHSSSAENRSISATEHSSSVRNTEASEKDQLYPVIQNLSPDELKEICYQLTTSDLQVREKFMQILQERKRSKQIQSQEVLSLDWEEAITYYEKEVPRVLKECESLFQEMVHTENYIYSHRHWDYVDAPEWDFEPGIKRLNRWAEELKVLVSRGHWVAGIAGLMVTKQRLEPWAEEFDDDYGDNDLIYICDEWEEHLIEAINRIVDSPNKKEADTLLKKIMDWILQQCHGQNDLISWMPIIRECILDLATYNHLKRSISKYTPSLMSEEPVTFHSEEGSILYWWIGLSLEFKKEQEAIETASRFEEFSSSLITMFVQYYEKHKQWNKAIECLTRIIETLPIYQSKPYYEWIIRIFQKKKDAASAQLWRIKMLLQIPSLDLFKQCLTELKDDSEKQIKIKEWLNHIKANERNRHDYIEILIFLGEIKEAWKEFSKYHRSPEYLPSYAQKLYKKMEDQDPKQLVSVYQNFAEWYIQSKKREGYKKAAKWLKNLKRVSKKAGQQDRWEKYIQELHSKYRRFPALMEELRKVNLI